MLWRAFSLGGEYKWIHILDDIVDKYNNTVHSTTRMKPAKVTARNERSLLKSTYTHLKIANKITKFKVGDHVRISKYREAFEKGYTPNWSSEIFIIRKIRLSNPKTYLLQDEAGKEITGGFYELELQKVKHPDAHLVEKTLIFAPSMEWGRENEEKVRRLLETIHNLEIKTCGLFIDIVHPFLGASPDGIIGDQGLVEIKCPFSARHMCIKEAIEKKVTLWKMDNNNFKLNTSHKWYYQVQGQLHIAQRRYCLLAVWTEKDMKVETIFRDDVFWENKMFPFLEKNFIFCLLPEIVDSRLSRNMEIREPLHILEAIENKQKT
ncbi:hypothetical protein NQ315_012373 [Exocentrus adspersus]|uniref:YqaJ viral recombinase domain-containing protein n=1 Tax=Exocentrus adspersus TaxID=1586481 RepID=A0AAV8VMV7_9CUCU|nr:hypothetical protein NQ315_012373 [Exocentrus adspersus]